jgi:hypothetical protein
MEFPLQSSNSKMFSFSVVSASPVEVVQVLCKYLKQKGCSECRPEGFVATPFKWHKTINIFIDFVPLLIEIAVEDQGGEMMVTINDMSLNDVIRRTRMCNDMVKFVNGNGFRATCTQQFPHCFRLLDDDFDMDDAFDMIIQSEKHSCSEQVNIDLVDIKACRCDVRENELQAVSCWSTSKIDSHHSLMKGLATSTISISALAHLVNLVDAHPSVASLQGLVM